MREYTFRTDGCSNTITTVQKDNYIAEINKVVDALIEMSKFMRTDYKTTWGKYTHEFITSKFTWEEVEKKLNERNI